jgi:predicted alpha/beta-hydrolase family hydrolase
VLRAQAAARARSAALPAEAVLVVDRLPRQCTAPQRSAVGAVAIDEVTLKSSHRRDLGCEYAQVTPSVRVREIETPSGLARAHITVSGSRPALGLAVLGHGAGGGVETPDLLAVTSALNAVGWTVARVEQPYRVQGRRAPEAAPRLDAAMIAVVAALRHRHRYPVMVGGRSSGARVACRTAAAVGASSVLALAFPLHPPGKPEKSRVEELLAVSVPTLVIQGDRDAFGTAIDLAAACAGRDAHALTIIGARGDHSLRQDPANIAKLVVDWVQGIG